MDRDILKAYIEGISVKAEGGDLDAVQFLCAITLLTTPEEQFEYLSAPEHWEKVA